MNKREWESLTIPQKGTIYKLYSFIASNSTPYIIEKDKKYVLIVKKYQTEEILNRKIVENLIKKDIFFVKYTYKSTVGKYPLYYLKPSIVEYILSITDYG